MRAISSKGADVNVKETLHIAVVAIVAIVVFKALAKKIPALAPVAGQL